MQKANATNGNAKARLPPALNPEQPALTQPWRDFVSRGFVASIKASFSGGTTSVLFELGPQVVTPEDVDRKAVPPGMAKHYIIESGLWAPVDFKQKQKGSDKSGVQLPKKSLVKDDLDGDKTNDQQLVKRATAVAEALTDTVARGRIGSLKFMRKGVDNFEIWWSKATPAMKTRLMMDEKHHKVLEQADHDRFANVVGKCPFRGTVPTPSEEEEDEEAPRTGKQVANGTKTPSPPRKK